MSSRWRRGGHYPGVTPISRKLLQYWADDKRENRVLFCQREAAETAIFLTEVAGRNGVTDWRKRLDEIGPNTVPRWVEVQGVVGETEHERKERGKYRRQQIVYTFAKRILDTYVNVGADRRPWTFPQLVQISTQWLEHCVEVAPGYDLGHLMLITEAQAEACEKIWGGIVQQLGDRRRRLRPMLNRFDSEGSTGDVDFVTRVSTLSPRRSGLTR